MQKLITEVARLLDKHNYMEDWCAISSLDIQDFKEFRHALPDAVNAYLKERDSYKLATDFAVPEDRLDDMINAYNKIGEKYRASHPRDGIHYLFFGHIGDNHLHFNFITENEAERETARQLYVELAKTAVLFGGTISGEHGVGKKQFEVYGQMIPYLELMYGKKGLLAIAEIKKIFDPNLVLNIGNIVPKEYME